MIYTVYADVLFILNFLVDFLCLYVSTYICRIKRKLILLFISSLIGGGYAVASLFINSKASFLIHIAVLLLMSFIASPSHTLKDIIKLSILYFWISAILGGVATAVISNFGIYAEHSGILYADVSPFSLIMIILSSAFLALPFLLETRNRINEKIVDVKIKRKGREKSFNALVDSGNLLSDPLSADGIILVKSEKLEGFFTESQMTAIKNLDVLSESFPTGIRLVSTDKGLIPVFRPEETVIKSFSKGGKREINALVGIDFSGGSFGGAGGLLPAYFL